jgi:hypothetical protein
MAVLTVANKRFLLADVVGSVANHMKSRIKWRLVYTAAAVLALAAQAQTPASVRMSGVVSKIDAAANAISLKTDSGDVQVTMQPKGSFRRVAPGETSLTNAATIAITDINTGDRVLAVGKASDDKSTLAATLVVVMSQGDIAKKQAAERADWDKRGVIGIVTAASPTEVAITVRGSGTAKTVIITPGANAEIKRYAPDSIKFSDARMSTLAEIKTGDQVRALGTKSDDGGKMTAEEIVSGSFREIAATVLSIDAAKNEIRVNDLATKKQIIVKINPDSNLRKLPPQMAQMLAARNRPPEEGGGRASAPGQISVAGPPDGRGGMRGGGGRGGGDLTQMLERLPNMTLADLKAGDAIILLSTVGTASDQLNAITMLAGVEPILTKPGTREMQLGSWSLGAGIGEGGQ